jgi:capsule polysaccharide export protein KpsE/RkpR
VRGLQSQGIQYEGEKGLKENLDQLAAMVRLDKTALQNVDGILQIAGETLYAKTLGVHATKEELTDCTNTMKQFLQKGLVVKLSTPSTNKSGIVSNLQDEWTLISSDKKTVNEATIDQTIKDLQSQASEKNEPLTVAVSRLKENVLRHIDVLVDMKKEKMSQASNLPKQSINTTSY